MTSGNYPDTVRTEQSGYIIDSRPGQVPYSIISSHVDYVLDHQWSGQDNPGWRYNIRHGGTPFGDFSGFRMELTAGTARWFHRILPIYWTNGEWQQHYEVTTAVSGFSNCLLPMSYGTASTDAINGTKAVYLQKAANLHRAVQGGVVFGELKETIHAFHHVSSGLGKVLRDYFGNLKKGRRSLRKASKASKLNFIRQEYLGFTYGWAPLASDVKSGAEAVARLSLDRPERTPVRANGGRESLVSKTQWGGTIGQSSFSCLNNLIDTTEVHLYGAYDTSVPESEAPAALFGSHVVKDFLPTIWELIPYSFLVDYFTNIGQIIEAYSYVNSMLIYSGMSIKVKRVCKPTDFVFYTTNIPVSLDPLDPHNGEEEIVSAGENAWVSETMTRVKNPDLVPDFQVHLPFKNRQYLNIIALLPNFRKLTPF
jgi:hypothetical protein